MMVLNERLDGLRNICHCVDHGRKRSANCVSDSKESSRRITFKKLLANKKSTAIKPHRLVRYQSL